MTCEAFRNSIDIMADLKRAINRDDLPLEIRSHLDDCSSCARYLDSVSTAGQILRNTQSVEVPSELYDKLINFGNEHPVKSGLMSGKLLVLYILIYSKNTFARAIYMDSSPIHPIHSAHHG